MDWNSLIYNGLGSATASIISRLLTHPLDTAKARLQAVHSSSNTVRYKGTLDVLQQTVRREGIMALYGGFGAIVIGGTPGTMLYLCSYDFTKDFLSKLASDDHAIAPRWNLPDFTIHFLSGMIAETVACTVYVPVDVIKERLQVQQNSSSSTSFNYKGSFDAYKQIMKLEGFSGIYKGYGATLASFGPFSAFYFLFYEKAKSSAQVYRGVFHGNDKNHSTTDSSSSLIHSMDSLPFPYIVLCSSLAGAMAAWLTSPLDMAKLRLQIQRGSQSKSYRNMIDCLLQTYNQEGLTGLWRGAGARVIHFAPATAITMSCYEQCRAYYAQHLQFRNF
jgi:hypothetical protein